MCLYMCVYMFVCVRAHIHKVYMVYICIYIFHSPSKIYTYIYIYACVYIYMNAYIHVGIYVFIYVYVCFAGREGKI